MTKICLGVIRFQIGGLFEKSIEKQKKNQRLHEEIRHLTQNSVQTQAKAFFIFCLVETYILV